jgi:hypothetical protein
MIIAIIVIAGILAFLIAILIGTDMSPDITEAPKEEHPVVLPPTIEIDFPVTPPVVETPVTEPAVETPVPEPAVETPVVETPVPEPVVETPVPEPVVETPVPEPVVETPANQSEESVSTEAEGDSQ